MVEGKVRLGSERIACMRHHSLNLVPALHVFVGLQLFGSEVLHWGQNVASTENSYKCLRITEVKLGLPA